MSIKQGEFLKELRIKNNYSQEKLGELLGLSRQSISKWEQGYATPDTDNLIKLSQIYGVSVDALLKCSEEEQTVGQGEAGMASAAQSPKPPKKKRGWFFIAYPVLTVIAYALIGIMFKKTGWATGWLVILTIPLYYTGVIAVEKKNLVVFCYPVLVIIVYLFCGFFMSLWHPLWVLFLTIPLFYIIAAKSRRK